VKFLDELSPLKVLFETLPQVGHVEWIGVRPGRGEVMVVLEEVEVDLDVGLVGDRFKGRPGSARQVTLIQREHLSVIASVLDRPDIDLSLLRRNIVVSGINLLALKDKHFRIGSAVLNFTGLCQPCSKMEQELGPGGYNAMRGHGGITASVVQAGVIRVGDKVFYGSK
jgi:MOSC domain-containing protein YiiM